MVKSKVSEQAFSPPSVQEAIASFLASPHVSRLRPATIVEYRSELTRFADWAQGILLDQINAKVVDAFLDHVRATAKPHKSGKTELSTYTLAGHVRVILTWLNWCLLDEEYGQYVKVDVIRRIRKPKVVKVIVETFSVQQITDLRKACAKEYNPHLRLRDEAILLLLLDTGIRANELCTLTMAHVDISPTDAHIKILGKGQKWGEVMMGAECRRFLSQYQRRFRQPTFEAQLNQAARGKKLDERQLHRLERDLKETQPFFMNRYGEPLTPSGLGRLVQRLGEWAEIEGVRCSPHTFRHTFASMFMRNGGDIYTLSKLLRHSSVKVTEEYLKSIRQWEARHHAQSVVDNL